LDRSITVLAKSSLHNDEVKTISHDDYRRRRRRRCDEPYGRRYRRFVIATTTKAAKTFLLLFFYSADETETSRVFQNPQQQHC
jgi:hypothetical protein